MDQPFGKYLMFENRLQKVYKHLSKQAKRQAISCYRIYDHDLPEFPFLIEKYEDKLYVAEYKRRHSMSDEEHEEWLKECKEVMTKVILVAESNIFIKLRQRKEGRGGQYQKLDESKDEFIVEESGLKFIVNLSDYLDTGLFLDHRITRQMVRQGAQDKKVLNLFAYTGSFSVYAIAGGAEEVTTVDLSKTYLHWAARSSTLNFPDYSNHHLVHADVLQYLKEAPNEYYDLIVMDPPTFSNSKRMEGILDIQRDHADMINHCLRILKKGGVLFFSTNFTKFNLEGDKINTTSIKDITKATTPFDFERRLQRFCYQIEK